MTTFYVFTTVPFLFRQLLFLSLHFHCLTITSSAVSNNSRCVTRITCQHAQLLSLVSKSSTLCKITGSAQLGTRSRPDRCPSQEKQPQAAMESTFNRRPPCSQRSEDCSEEFGLSCFSWRASFSFRHCACASFSHSARITGFELEAMSQAAGAGIV